MRLSSGATAEPVSVQRQHIQRSHVGRSRYHLQIYMVKPARIPIADVTRGANVPPKRRLQTLHYWFSGGQSLYMVQVHSSIIHVMQRALSHAVELSIGSEHAPRWPHTSAVGAR